MAYDLQTMGENALTKMGISGRNLLILPIQTNLTPVACALGFRLDIQPSVVWIVGSILINKQTLELFTEEEWNFIIHHECAHIVRNDSIASLIVNIPELYAKFVEVVDKNQLPKLIIDLFKTWSIVANGQQPVNAQLLRSQELRADELAVRTMGNKRTAIEFFSRMSNGDLNGSSHVFEVFHNFYPALTWGERISALQSLRDL